MTKKSLWGDLGDLEKVPTPKSHLREQADILSEATKYVLMGHVSEVVSPGGTFQLELNIIVQNLNNYKRTILEVTHKIEPYPLRVRDYENSVVYECKDEGEFLAILENILTSPKVRRVISSLIAQSKA